MIREAWRRQKKPTNRCGSAGKHHRGHGMVLPRDDRRVPAANCGKIISLDGTAVQTLHSKALIGLDAETLSKWRNHEQSPHPQH
jgi:hypothetical protein